MTSLADHRHTYSPAQMFIVGRRMADDYTVDNAVTDYLALHPDADPQQIRAAIEGVASAPKRSE